MLKLTNKAFGKSNINNSNEETKESDLQNANREKEFKCFTLHTNNQWIVRIDNELKKLWINSMKKQ